MHIPHNFEIEGVRTLHDDVQRMTIYVYCARILKQYSLRDTYIRNEHAVFICRNCNLCRRTPATYYIARSKNVQKTMCKNGNNFNTRVTLSQMAKSNYLKLANFVQKTINASTNQNNLVQYENIVHFFWKMKKIRLYSLNRGIGPNYYKITTATTRPSLQNRTDSKLNS